MIPVDPAALARRQLERDRERMSSLRRFLGRSPGGGFEHLLARKVARMVASPLALLRGTAPMFYRLLDRHPALADGPGGEGWIVGDAHLENFGAYRTGALSIGVGEPAREERVVFDLNDFDDATLGPWRFDVLRLATSLLLAGREIGADGSRALALADALVEAYVAAVWGEDGPLPSPPVVRELVDRVRRRTRRQLLDQRTQVVDGARRFLRGERYRDVPAKLRARTERALARYARRLPGAERPPDGALQVLDVAFRIAGTGSLGSLRVAVLVAGKGGEDGAWIFDLKEEGDPSSACLLRVPRLERAPPAERVTEAIRACLAHPPRMMGTTRLRGSSMLVRRLAPQEDRLDLNKLRSADLEPLARHLGALLGAAHRRGKRRAPKRPWTDGDRSRLLASAIALAGMHEAVYLAFCDLARRSGLDRRAGVGPGPGEPGSGAA